jgi:hypothetical protein
VKPITFEAFQAWLAAYSQASIEDDPRASADLFSEDAEYYETPFAAPLVGREAIYQYWEQGARNLKDKTAEFQILAIDGNCGLARWQATFVPIASGERVALDCLFLVEFDDQQKCRIFREWWHRQVMPSISIGEPFRR